MRLRFLAGVVFAAVAVSCSNGPAACRDQICDGGGGSGGFGNSGGSGGSGGLGGGGGGSRTDAGPSDAGNDAGVDAGGATDSGVVDAGAPTSCVGLADSTACAFGERLSGPSGGGHGDAFGLCCGGECVDPFQDPKNCHACGTVCTGVCSSNAKHEVQPYCLTPNPQFGVLSCTPGSGFLPTNCGTDAGALGVCCYVPFTAGDVVCSTLADDPLNCGACGARCPGGQTCSGGQCSGAAAPCTVGHLGEYCDVDAGLDFVCCPGGGCTSILSDANNCGYCGIACAAGQGCFGGQCLDVTCTAQTEAKRCALGDGGAGECCSQVCQDIDDDATNCGGCGKLCPASETCRFGYCGFDLCTTSVLGDTCHLAPGTKGLCCSSGCVDSSSDPLNCGGCGLPCPADAGCSNGACQ